MLSWNTCCIQSGLCKLSSLSLALSVSVKSYRALSLSLRLPLANSPTHHLKVASVCFHMVGKSSASKFFSHLLQSPHDLLHRISSAHLFYPPNVNISASVLGFYKTYSPSCVPEELLKSTDVAVPEWKLTANDSDHCKRSHFWVGQIWILRWLHHHRATPIIKAKSIALRLVSSLSHPLFFPPPFLMKNRSEFNDVCNETQIPD